MDALQISGIGFLFILAACFIVLAIRADRESRRPAGESAPSVPLVTEVTTEKKRRNDREVVSYHSNRHGERDGILVGQDRSGRLVIQLFAHPKGVFMKRQPHLVKRNVGWIAA